MAKNLSIEDLKDYCLRALGHPVINIEVSDDQCYDRITDAMRKFFDRHYAGSFEEWIPYTITAADVARGWIAVDPSVVAIMEILESQNSTVGMGEEFENLNFRIANSDMADYIVGSQSGGGGPFLAMQQLAEKMDMIKRFLSPNRRFRFNHVMHRLDLQGKWVEGHTLVLNCWIKYDPDEYIDVYNEDFVMRYSTALIGMQWGRNIFKYAGVELPGGVTMNGQGILDYYQDKVNDLDESFFQKFELPAEFWIA